MKKDLRRYKRTRGIQPKHEPGKAITHGLRAYIDMAAIDKRTKLGKAISALKDQLRNFVGEPTPISELLIQRITYKSIKLSLYESYALSELSNSEANVYLPMANSLRLDLQALAQLAGKSKAPSYEEIMRRLQKGKAQ